MWKAQANMRPISAVISITDFHSNAITIAFLVPVCVFCKVLCILWLENHTCVVPRYILADRPNAKYLHFSHMQSVLFFVRFSWCSHAFQRCSRCVRLHRFLGEALWLFCWLVFFSSPNALSNSGTCWNDCENAGDKEVNKVNCWFPLKWFGASLGKGNERWWAVMYWCSAINLFRNCTSHCKLPLPPDNS